jgi:hypothetical protein
MAKAGHAPAGLTVITAAGGLAAILGALAVGYGEAGRPDVETFVPDAPVELRVAARSLLLAANAVFLIAVISAFRAPLHYPAVATFAALYMGVLATEHMLNAGSLPTAHLAGPSRNHNQRSQRSDRRGIALLVTDGWALGSGPARVSTEGSRGGGSHAGADSRARSGRRHCERESGGHHVHH